jgi:hypothetical protein
MNSNKDVERDKGYSLFTRSVRPGLRVIITPHHPGET